MSESASNPPSVAIERLRAADDCYQNVDRLSRCLCINWIKTGNGLCHISEKVRQCISNIRMISQWWPLVSFWSIKVVSLCCAVLSVALFPSGLLCTFLGPIFSQFLVSTACTVFYQPILSFHSCASYLRLCISCIWRTPLFARRSGHLPAELT